MKMDRMYRIWIAALLIAIPGGFYSGCATNPVTGERELSFISEQQEVRMGEQYYGPTQQTEGGPYNTMPELTAYVNEVGRKLVEVSDRPELPYEFVVLNSPVPNAWALPGGKIAINRGLLVVLENEAELAAVLAHEIVHAAARHSAQQMERQTLGNAITTAAMLRVASTVDEGRNRDLLLGAAHTTAALGSQIIHSKYGRDAEKEADYFGMRYMAEAGYDPQAAVTLQEKFVELSEGRNPGWLEGLFASHPPSRERVEENKRTLQELPEGGILGKERYEARLANLREARPAYEKYEQAIEALNKGDRARALRLTEEARSILPEEGLFDALEARIHVMEGDRDRALRSIRNAIGKNPDYFAFHMMEGQIHNELGNLASARTAFTKSNQLLPTAESSAALGFLELEFGNTNAAAGHLSRAARFSDTPAGKAAYQALVPLEMEANPGHFIKTSPKVGSEGRLLVRVVNRSPIPYQLIVLEVVTADRKRKELAVTRPIANGEGVLLETGFGPYDPEVNPEELARARVVRVIVDN